jgi:hypothetical protein
VAFAAVVALTDSLRRGALHLIADHADLSAGLPPDSGRLARVLLIRSVLARCKHCAGERPAGTAGAAIVAALERQLAKGDKALIGNTGFRRYLKTISEEHFAIDPDKIEAEKKFDGIFVLRTNTDLNPLEAMLCYKQLWTVEQIFRTAKHCHLLEQQCSRA